MVDPVESRSKRRCVTRDLERSISRLDETVEVPTNVPRYSTCHTPVVAAGKESEAPGELFWPYAVAIPGQLRLPTGVAVHEETHQIFVVGHKRVEIFSETGEFISQLGVIQLSNPWGIAMHGDSLYVSCLARCTICQFSLIEMCYVRMIGGERSNNDNGQFNSPRQLTTDLIGRVFIADCNNDRICVHDPDLNHLRNITHQSMSRPEDVKVSRDCLYVLCPYNNSCMIVLTLEGDLLHSLIPSGEGMDVSYACFFCLDPLSNFVLSDRDSDSIRVFSPEGNLLHTIGREGDQPGMFIYPRGVAIAPNGRLVCVSQNRNYGLQIFF